MIEQRNLIMAVVLAILILMGWDYFFMPKPSERAQNQPGAEQSVTPGGGELSVDPTLPAVPGDALPTVVTREAALATSERVMVKTPALSGSIALKGGRMDDLTLLGYRETQDPESDNIVLLSPAASESPYFAEFGWLTADPAIAVPGPESAWALTNPDAVLTPENPVELTWDNGAGLTFVRELSVDENFMFTIHQEVINTTDTALALFPYGRIVRTDTPTTLGFFILHEGPLGVLGDTLTEVDYDDLRDDGPIQETSTGGWIGITDKYWLTALLFDQETETKAQFTHYTRAGHDRYQTDYRGAAVTIAPGQTQEMTSHFFAGAKVVSIIDAYEKEFGVKRFDLAIDFGWFYFLTKPFFYSLTWLNGYLGNFGLAILAFTVLIKLVLFPLANKQFRAMDKLKKVQPKMKELQERYKDDKVKLQQEMMELYKREKANPAAGCLPLFVQIPIFFALYKVLFVTIEMRHAPFFGWIKDLSAPDPTSIFNLFGLLPFDPPSFLMVGVWPIIMGASMWLQQKMNPQPPDPMQAKIMMFLPFVFTFLLATFPAGLVIYWAWNNVLSIAQQWVITRPSRAEAKAEG